MSSGGEQESHTVLPPGIAPVDVRRRCISHTKKLIKEWEADANHEIFESLLRATGEPGPTLPRKSLLRYLRSVGFLDGDERLSHVYEHLCEGEGDLWPKDITFLGTKDTPVPNVLWRAIHDRLVVPDFNSFTSDIKELYSEALKDTSGKNADYIPQLARVNPDQFGVSVCTIDGQRFAVGDASVPFCVQSCSKVVTYAIAQTLHGADKVHEHVGVEPSGMPFNQMILDERGKKSDLKAKQDLAKEGMTNEVALTKVRPAIPHNPYINAGAIMCASLVMPDAPAADRFDHVLDTWKKLCGASSNPRSSLPPPTFATSTYLSERSTADRNFCLAYMMKEEGAFLSPDADILDALDSYFMYCSIECTAQTLSVIAATFANGGTCPVTGVKVFDHSVVRNCLSVMQTCGMYDYSGTFAYRMGFPAKSGVGGGLMIVIPGVCGFGTWSPRLDPIGNSARGVKFCKLLSDRFAFHMFAPRPDGVKGRLEEDEGKQKVEFDGGNDDEKDNVYLSNMTPEAKERRTRCRCIDRTDPRRPTVPNDDVYTNLEVNLYLLWAAKVNDINGARHIVARGHDVNGYDYDLRSALHVAASEGHAGLVRYLLRLGADPLAVDKFGGTPLSDAKRRGGDVEMVRTLERASAAEAMKAAAETSVISCNKSHGVVSKVANDVYRSLQALLEPESSRTITRDFLLDIVERSGIRRNDERLKDVVEGLPPPPEILTPLHIENFVLPCRLVLRALQGRLVVPDWGSFSQNCTKCFNKAKLVTKGKVADYIPVLSCIDPDKFGVSVCSVDGQLWSHGSMDEFGVQSSCKPINHAIALETTSFRNVYKHVGIEPSGRPFNEMALDRRRVDVESGGHGTSVPTDATSCEEEDDDDFDTKYDDQGRLCKPTAIPHNPLINSGAIMCCALIDQGMDVPTKLETVAKYWHRLTGGTKEFCVNEEMYLSESETADRNRCLSYMMKEEGAFPAGTNLEDELEFYFKCCSQMQDVESMSIVAGTLANGGRCPVTNERIFSHLTVQSVLAVMFTCGMYDYSGQFSFSMGFPSKSGVAGSILMVVPNVMGICTWSPPLDENGNSCRGIAFSKCLEEMYELHIFDKATETLGDQAETKQDLHFRPDEEIYDLWDQLSIAVIGGDMGTVQNFTDRYGTDLLNISDYDQRTALHLACSEGQPHMVNYLIMQPGIALAPTDRWGKTPLDDAKRNGSEAIVTLMTQAMEK